MYTIHAYKGLEDDIDLEKDENLSYVALTPWDNAFEKIYFRTVFVQIICKIKIF